MTRQEAEALGYVVATRETTSEGAPPPRVAVVTVRRGTTRAPWAAVEQALPGPELDGLGAVLDGLVERINEPVPPEPEPEPYVDPLDVLRDRLEVVERRLADLEALPQTVGNPGVVGGGKPL